MFQDRNALWMEALGTLGDSPPNTLQPALGDGVHLRWAFPPQRGFPWYGYYLFRRPTREANRERCLQPWLKDKQSGLWPSPQLPLGIGTLVSDQPLVFTDDFPPAGIVEADLDGRQYIALQLPVGQPGWRADVTIGFRRREGSGSRHCVDFRRDRPQRRLPNPLTRDDAVFAAFDHTSALRPIGGLFEIGTSVGWDVGFHAEIKLPCTSNRVEVTLSQSAAAPKVVALDAAGNAVDTAVMSGNGPEMLTLEGKGISSVQIDAPQDETALLSICWFCEDEATDGGKAAIGVLALLEGITVASAVATGNAGDVVEATLRADAFDEVVVGSGDAALIDICVANVRTALGRGWEPVADFEYPLCLPVAHTDYPCPGAPASAASAKARALGRVRYGPPGDWAGAPFAQVRDRLDRLVVGGPPSAGGDPMHIRFDAVAGSPAPPAPPGGEIRHEKQRPLDMLLVASLHPPIAEMLGLAWLDKSAAPGVHYDYLLVADHDNSLGGNAASALSWLATAADFTGGVDGFISFDNVVAPATPVPAPADLKAYALPGSTVAPSGGGAIIDSTNVAGLIWERHEIDGGLAAGAPIMYHVWRASLGNAAAPSVLGDGDFEALTKASPLPVSRPKLDPPEEPDRAEDWPPFAMHYVDTRLPDGWYAYRVSAIDIFGRHSANSVSAQWWQWDPVPAPRPWYYVGASSNSVINPAAIRLLDTIAPPPPPGVEAFALDPDDPTVLRDTAWSAWRASLSAAEQTSLVGLRVRWRWTLDQQRQAPDVREFRIYYEPGPANTLRGRVTSVVNSSVTESEVVTDIPNAQPADSYTGLSLRVGAHSFRVLGNSAVTPLRLRVGNIGPTDNQRPASRTRCALTLTPGHTQHEDFSRAQPWQDRMLAVGFAEHVTVAPNGDRGYQVLLPVAGSADRSDLPLVTTLAEPVATGIVGVTAADDKPHTPDHRGDPARFGNESRVGGPATVLRVHRQPPPAPVVLPDSPSLYASPADYHGHSYFTYRWQPVALLKTYIYRALDDAVFRADLALRPRPPMLAGDLHFFPDEAVDSAWNGDRRQQVADDLNVLNALAPGDVNGSLMVYRVLSNDALRVLAALPGIERVFVQVNPEALDPDEPDAAAPGGLRWRRLGPDVAPASLGANERAYVDTLDGRGTNRWFYRCTYVDEVYNIGALSRSSPPVWLPDVTPPRAPKITKVTSGERRVTLAWASNREADLAEYRIYRTDNVDNARDVREMDHVQTVAVPPGDPSARPATVIWADDPVPGQRDLWYRVVAFDVVDADPAGLGGNASDPSPAMRVRAYDLSVPVPPALTTVEWVRVDEAGVLHALTDPVPAGAEWETAVRLQWAGAGDGVRLLVQVKAASGGGFRVASPWLAPGTTAFSHRNSRNFEAHDYRLKAVNGAGNANLVFQPSTLPPIA